MRLGCLVIVGLSLLAGCHAATPPQPPELLPEEEAKLHASFDEARAAMASHDAKGWTEQACRATASTFEGVADRLAKHDREGSLAARYDQGLALARCQLHAEAARAFEALLAQAPDHHRAKVQLTLHRLELEGPSYLSEAIGALSEAVVASEFKNVEALVSLASLMMDRKSDQPDDDGANDFERARKNLRRALAVDDGYMAAYNQLAILHLEIARREAGRTPRALVTAAETAERPDTATLEMAALICSQALRKRPGYAPIHNTAGLIDAELGNLSGAAQSFGRARKLDPRLFEAHMNYAAVNLQFRGFDQAEEAYRAALDLEPKSYEAHLGLALALRGRVGAAPNGEALLAEARKTLELAKTLAPDRPEAYFNEAILVEEFFARGAPEQAKPKLLEAKALYASFAERAKGEPTMKAAGQRAAERVRDIDQQLSFLEEQP
ncbi:MAG: tetratricopeptide repeat protein [Polyangiaceae bacterium]